MAGIENLCVWTRSIEIRHVCNPDAATSEALKAALMFGNADALPYFCHLIAVNSKLLISQQTNSDLSGRKEPRMKWVFGRRQIRRPEFAE